MNRRDEEITKIAKSIEELAAIFKARFDSILMCTPCAAFSQCEAPEELMQSLPSQAAVELLVSTDILLYTL